MKILIIGRDISYEALANLLNHFLKEASLPKYSFVVNKNEQDSFNLLVKKYCSFNNIFLENVIFSWEKCETLSELDIFYKNIYDIELMFTINIKEKNELIEFFCTSNKIRNIKVNL